MIEQLFQEERVYGEPQFSVYRSEAIQAQEALYPRLDQEERDLLERYSGALAQQSSVEVKGAFVDGFCTAMELVWDVLTRRE